MRPAAAAQMLSASIIDRGHTARGGRPQVRPANDSAPTRPPEPQAHATDTPPQVCFFEDAQYRGEEQCFTASTPWVGDLWNDRFSSVLVNPHSQVEIFEHAFFRGRSLTLTTQHPRLADLSFSNTVSSFRVSAASTPTLKLSSVRFAQGPVYAADDPELLLVGRKETLVLVTVTGPQGSTPPPARLHIDSPRRWTHLLASDADLGVQIVDLKPPRRRELPTGHEPIEDKDVPSFETSYSAFIPADWVRPGLRVTVDVSGVPNKTFAPAVGKGAWITLVTVPVQIGDSVAELPPDLGPHLAAIFPLSEVTVRRHPVYRSRHIHQMPTSEDEWDAALTAILGEMNDLYALGQAKPDVFFFGFVPKRTLGVAGIALRPGHAAVGIDLPDDPDRMLSMLKHELGHNLSLLHAPCGGADEPDPRYPYPEARLGQPGRYVWMYRSDMKRFHDPRPTDRHDLMSYCESAVFSDYNYREMHRYLSSVDAISSDVRGGRVRRSADAAAAAKQEVLLISGSERGDQIKIHPVKALMGVPSPSQGSHVLRLRTAAGEVVDHAFEPQSIDHARGVRQFRLLVPRLQNIQHISVMRNGETLHTLSASPGMPATSTLTKHGAGLQIQELYRKATLRWNAAVAPFVTLTWTDGSQRLTLAQDLQGGEAQLPTEDLPASGWFEVVLSDGLNAERVELAR